MPRHPDSFRFSKRLGKRLRSLRKHAGLSQGELAERMGRKAGHGQSTVSLLEAGVFPYPSLALVADYLRACRARFDDILDLLNEYAELPPVPEAKTRKAIAVAIQRLPEPVQKKVAHYDAKTTAQERFEGKAPLSPGERMARACRLAAAYVQKARLENELAEVLDELKVPAPATARRPLAEFGRKVWGILKKTRARHEARRPELLDAAFKAALAGHYGTEEQLRCVLDAVLSLFLAMEKQGELDYVPPYGEVRGIRRTKVIRAERRAEYEEERKAQERARRPLRMLEAIGYELDPVFERMGIMAERRRTYRIWLNELLRIGLATTQDPVARQQQTADLVARTSKPDEAAQVAAVFWPPFDKWYRLLKLGGPPAAGS
jgi:transcriptional regulator with XRE-family HTH domain